MSVIEPSKRAAIAASVCDDSLSASSVLGGKDMGILLLTQGKQPEETDGGFVRQPA
jgi:hypothetical protein